MKKLLLLLALLPFTLFAQDGFNDWPLTNWSTESGITVVEETTTTNEGSSSASITVTTTSQGNTDFRTNLDVVNGSVYNLCFDIYHVGPANSLEARIYDGSTYRNYSDGGIVGSWQTLCYEYTATSTMTRNLGLRFYDGSSFSGSAVVYVDNFTINGALPVSLISFDVRTQDASDIFLSWQTASEENNSHFEVEHSTNGRNFQTLDKVIGNGTTSEIQEYNYVHDNAAVGTNYYRLRQVDFDGGFEYSDVVSIEVEGDSKVNLYPTVADQQITVSFGETTREDKEVLIYNIAGLQVSAAQIPAGTDRFEVPVANLQTGIYFVHMMVNGELATFKFVR